MVTLSEAKIYVGTYGKYNAGSIFGKWLDLSDYSIKTSLTKRVGNSTKTKKMPNICIRDWEKKKKKKHPIAQSVKAGYLKIL